MTKESQNAAGLTSGLSTELDTLDFDTIFNTAVELKYKWRPDIPTDEKRFVLGVDVYQALIAFPKNQHAMESMNERILGIKFIINYEHPKTFGIKQSI